MDGWKDGQQQRQQKGRAHSTKYACVRTDHNPTPKILLHRAPAPAPVPCIPLASARTVIAGALRLGLRVPGPRGRLRGHGSREGRKKLEGPARVLCVSINSMSPWRWWTTVGFSPSFPAEQLVRGWALPTHHTADDDDWMSVTRARSAWYFLYHTLGRLSFKKRSKRPTPSTHNDHRDATAPENGGTCRLFLFLSRRRDFCVEWRSRDRDGGWGGARSFARDRFDFDLRARARRCV